MNEYHKIQTLWIRESEKPCNMMIGKFANDYFEYLKDCPWQWFEKIDGTNMRVIWDGHRIRVRGKTDRAQIQPNVEELIDERFNSDAAEQLFEQAFGSKTVSLYGEAFGAGVQSGGAYMEDGQGIDITFFDVFIDGLWLSRENVENVCEKLGLKVVPPIGIGTLSQASAFTEVGFVSAYGDRKAEGMIMKPQVEVLDRRGNRVMAKLKTKDFEKLETK